MPLIGKPTFWIAKLAIRLDVWAFGRNQRVKSFSGNKAKTEQEASLAKRLSFVRQTNKQMQRNWHAKNLLNAQTSAKFSQSVFDIT